MIRFWTDDNKLILSYTPDFGSNHDWVTEELDREGDVTIKKTFKFQKKQLHHIESAEPTSEIEDAFDDAEPNPVHFVFAHLNGDYYKITKGILVDSLDIYIYKDWEITPKLFVADTKISIFKIAAGLVKNDIYLGGDHPNAFPEKAFQKLLSQFPTTYEQTKYVEARVASLLRDYIDQVSDAETKYHKYMNKKSAKHTSDLKKLFMDSELVKFETILEKLHRMLKEENTYSEKQWQEEILQILLLIYPKYIAVFRNVPVKGENLNDKYLDYLLVDSNGTMDIIEIKKPFEKAIITEGTYRNNFIPLRELSGTIMQLEKYIYFLNRWGPEGESKLTTKYKDQLPEGLKLKITNPGGLIIMGRDKNLTEGQKLDFEVVKRKYKNVVDIITYDDLVRRLHFTIEQIKKS